MQMIYDDGDITRKGQKQQHQKMQSSMTFDDGTSEDDLK